MHSIATMCRVLGVSASGYYAHSKRPPSARARADAELSARIAQIHQCSRATYGAPRIHAELAATGIHVGRKRVARLMKATRLSRREPAPVDHHHRTRAGGTACTRPSRA